MSVVTYQQNVHDAPVAQRQSGPEGAADVYVAGGTVGIEQAIQGNTNGVVLRPSANAGTQLSNASSGAYVNSLVIKAAPGKLHGLTGYNSLASIQFIQLFDAVALPADGAAPVLTFTVAASSNFTLSFDVLGRYFTNGIVICNSTTGPTKTLGAANCYIDAQYV